jgi:ribosome-associated protein
MAEDDPVTIQPDIDEPDETRELALVAARAADDKQGVDTIVLSVAAVLAITELFVVTSAANRRLVRTIADEIEHQVRERFGRAPVRVEGISEMQWVLIDYGDVVVHVFSEENRRFYNIERLYSDVPTIDWRADDAAEAGDAGGAAGGSATDEIIPS